MAIFFLDSFSHYATADIYRKWTTPNNTTFNFDRASIVPGSGRCRQNALKVGYSTDTTVGSGPCLVTAPKSAFCVGAGFQAVTGVQEGGRGIFRFSSGGVSGTFRQVEAIIQSDMTIQLGTGTATGAFAGNITTSYGRSTQTIQADSWHFIELLGTISPTVGTLQLWVDGVKWLDLTGLNTDPVGSGTWNTFQLGAVYGAVTNGGATGGGIQFSDLYLGSATTDRKGDSRVFARVPNADGDLLQWTPLTAGSHYREVDDSPPDGDTTYNSVVATGLTDLYTFPVVGIPSGTVYTVQLAPMCKKADVGVGSVQPTTKLGGVVYKAASQAVADGNYLYYLQVYDATDPSGAAWTVSSANALQAGVTSA